MALKKRQSGIEISACTNYTKGMVLEGNMTRYSYFKPGTLYVQQRNYRSIYLYGLGHGVIMENSNLGHGSLNKNMA
jgi:hypothetical protein